MKKRDTIKRSVDICSDKIKEILKEYDCFLDFDEESYDFLCVDKYDNFSTIDQEER